MQRFWFLLICSFMQLLFLKSIHPLSIDLLVSWFSSFHGCSFAAPTHSPSAACSSCQLTNLEQWLLVSKLLFVTSQFALMHASNGCRRHNPPCSGWCALQPKNNHSALRFYCHIDNFSRTADSHFQFASRITYQIHLKIRRAGLTPPSSHYFNTQQNWTSWGCMSGRWWA